MTRNPTHAKDGRLVTPGEILLEAFLEPAGMRQTGLAVALGVPPRRINEIVLGKRSVTAGTCGWQATGAVGRVLPAAAEQL